MPDPRLSAASPLKVVIVGAGFAGLSCAKALRKAPVEVLVLDRQNHHCFQPLLYQVATAALAPNDVAWPIRSILRGQSNATVLLAEVKRISVENKIVEAAGASYPYDVLVLATGARHSYFGHDDWAPFAPGLKSVEDATAIRRRILLAFEQAERAEDAEARAAALTFVIVGGGPTGVELAGAIAELARYSLPKEFRRFDPRQARILLVEAGPRLLPALPEHLSDYAQRALARKGVETRLNCRVIGCDRGGVDTLDGRMAADTVLWAAGVQASPAARWAGAAHDRVGRALVGPDLAVQGRNDVYIIGDAAAAAVDSGFAPAIAPAAKQMGRYVARRIAAQARGEPPPPAFQYRHAGDLATIGRDAAVVRRQGLELTGFPGWLFWSVAHIWFLIGARNRIAVAFNWVWDYLTFQRGVRLITEPMPPDPPLPPARSDAKDVSATSRAP